MSTMLITNRDYMTVSAKPTKDDVEPFIVQEGSTKTEVTGFKTLESFLSDRLPLGTVEQVLANYRMKDGSIISLRPPSSRHC
jgi:hypothetical protein